MVFGKKDAVDRAADQMELSMSDILKAANEPRVVEMRPRVLPNERQPQRMPSIWNAASWIRSLTYEDMMQSATEMNAIRGEDVIDTPEKIAKLIHAWSKAVTEVEP